MDITPGRRQRLNELIEDRRLGLGITWRELARSAGVSYEAVRALRRGPGGIAELTARKLDRALQWQGGSIAAIISGGEPAELPQPGAGPDDPAVVRDYWYDPVIGPYVRRLWELDVTRDQRLALIEDLARILGSNGTGSGASAPG